MSGRHSLTRPSARLKRAALPIGALLGVAAAAGATVVALRGWDAASSCTGELPLQVTVAPAVEQVVRAAADEFEAGSPVAAGKCVKVKIAARDSAAVTADLAGSVNPGHQHPGMWIPDSSLWATRGQQQSATAGPALTQLDIRPSLASSPLVVVATQGNADKLGSPTSWKRIVEGSAPAVIGDPTNTTEGLATLMLVRSLMGNPDGSPKPELVAALLRVSRSTLPAMRDAYDKVRQDPVMAPAFSATEQSVISHNRSGVAQKVVALYPDEGTVAFDFPVVRVTGRDEASGTGEAADAFEKALRGESASKRFIENGFRDQKGRASESWTKDVGVSANPPALLPLPTPEQASDVLRTYSAVTLDARMLGVIDVSGSMSAKTSTGQTRIELARDAAGGALGLLPDSTQVGLWVFSTDHAKDRHWTELVSLGPLAEPLEGGSRRDALKVAAASLPSRVKGNTAMYETVLAAYRTVRQGYDAAKINSVVLITDGANDNKSGLDLNTLLQTLRAEANPAQPLPIIAIGMGPEADIAALQQISQVTGGKAYQAKEATEIRSVLMDALIQRRCRPNC